jgi:hypothetical protein
MTVLADAFRWILQIAVVVLFAGWFVVSAANQRTDTRRWISRITNVDVCALVPIWTFFAPNPGDSDTHLLFRDRDDDGRITCWREVPLAGRRSIVDLWNPARRIHKAIVDVAFDLSRPDDADPGDAPDDGGGTRVLNKRRVISFPYLLILNFVSELPGDFGAEQRQFAIARTPGLGGRDQPHVTMVSAFHRLGER